MSPDKIRITMAVLLANHTWAEASVVIPARLFKGGIAWSEDQIEEVGEEALLKNNYFQDESLVAMTLLHWEPINDTSGA